MGQPGENKYEHLTREVLKAAIDAGMSRSTMAAAYGIPTSTLSRLIAAYGLVRASAPRNPRPVYATVTPEQAAYLREHYGTVPRSQLARALGVDKVTCNNMILQLRLGS